MIKKIILWWLRIDKESLGVISEEVKPGSILVPINNYELWKEESFYPKLKSLIIRTWKPDINKVRDITLKNLFDEIFGKKEDFGEILYGITVWQQNQKAEDYNTILTTEDIERANAITSLGALTRIKYRGVTSKPKLNLALANKVPFMALLIPAISIKIPILSIQYCVDINAKSTFASIRNSNHPKSQEIILYLYEILNLQYKTALALHNYFNLWSLINKKKSDQILLTEEIDLVNVADCIFLYLKASIEKAVVLLGLIYGLGDLSDKKAHKQRLSSLSSDMPLIAKEQPYYQYFIEEVSSESLEELNKYRTGLMHKKGISELQPHSFTNQKSENTPVMKFMNILHDRHCRNSALILTLLALMCDELVRLDAPEVSPMEHAKEIFKYIHEIESTQYVQ